ncbi:MAG: hypothetical protein A07HB70_00333 [uncultured archaeon A07HB70]|nr:MAG: hypothetical protein A07HB70_00333 [uncultured archaeon A07HB70]
MSGDGPDARPGAANQSRFGPPPVVALRPCERSAARTCHLRTSERTGERLYTPLPVFAAVCSDVPVTRRLRHDDRFRLFRCRDLRVTAPGTAHPVRVRDGVGDDRTVAAPLRVSRDTRRRRGDAVSTALRSRLRSAWPMVRDDSRSAVPAVHDLADAPFVRETPGSASRCSAASTTSSAAPGSVQRTPTATRTPRGTR